MIKFIKSLFTNNGEAVLRVLREYKAEHPDPEFVLLRKKTVLYHGLRGIKIDLIEVPYSLMSEIQFSKVYPGYEIYDYKA
jgi:hypothetical protein